MLEFKFIYGGNGFKVSKDLRKSVFCDELGEKDYSDGFEDSSYHFVGYDKIVQISAARLTQISDADFKISYVAVKKDYRKQYVGDLVMRALADKAVSMGGISIILEAPLPEKGFFEFEGYEEYGADFEKNGKLYIMMKKDLTKIQPCRGCKK